MKKKVLIISQKSFDVTTELVMDWITFYGHKAIRFNGELLEDNDNSIVITNNKTESVFNFNKKLLESNIDRIWYRRWTYENHLVNTFISTIKDYKNNGKFFLDLYNNLRPTTLKDTVNVEEKGIKFVQFVSILLRGISFKQTQLPTNKGETFDVSVASVIDHIIQI